jgi:hypothetical protein
MCTGGIPSHWATLLRRNRGPPPRRLPAANALRSMDGDSVHRDFHEVKMRPMMRVLAVVLILLAAASAPIRAQSPAQPQSEPQGAEKAQGQEISIEALQGVAISGVVNYTGRFRTHLGEGTSNIVWNFRLRIGPGSAVSMSHTRNVRWQTKEGPKTASLSKSATGTIGLPKQTSDGAALWLLEANTLVLLKVFEVGGNSTKITLARRGSGLSCSVTAPMVREVGAGASKTKAAVGGKVEMLDIRQTSSSCRVDKAG